MTWLWARDASGAGAVREALDVRGCAWEPGVRSGQPQPLVTNIGIGVQGLESLQALQAAEYTFRWHHEQHALNRAEDLYGIPVEG
ncbi:MAG: hypothetical protein JWN06_3411 [Propionibacteriaceae bacterium]|jgi:hypothetical protein|nr:hypothetical protein [Propionibacteriaceae bacterium]